MVTWYNFVSLETVTNLQSIQHQVRRWSRLSQNDTAPAPQNTATKYAVKMNIFGECNAGIDTVTFKSLDVDLFLLTYPNLQS
jgi:hypothetical protein